MLLPPLLCVCLVKRSSHSASNCLLFCNSFSSLSVKLLLFLINANKSDVETLLILAHIFTWSILAYWQRMNTEDHLHIMITYHVCGNFCGIKFLLSKSWCHFKELNFQGFDFVLCICVMWRLHALRLWLGHHTSEEDFWWRKNISVRQKCLTAWSICCKRWVTIGHMWPCALKNIHNYSYLKLLQLDGRKVAVVIATFQSSSCSSFK